MAARTPAVGHPLTTPATAETRPAAKGKSGLSKKAGPLPVWGWVALVAGGGLAWWYWRKKQAAAAASTTAASATAADTSATSPTTAVPVPTGTGLIGSQYADLTAQNAAIYEAIQDLQGPPSTSSGGGDQAADEAAQDKAQAEAEQDQDQAAKMKPVDQPRKNVPPPKRPRRPPPRKRRTA